MRKVHAIFYSSYAEAPDWLFGPLTDKSLRFKNYEKNFWAKLKLSWIISPWWLKWSRKKSILSFGPGEKTLIFKLMWTNVISLQITKTIHAFRFIFQNIHFVENVYIIKKNNLFRLSSTTTMYSPFYGFSSVYCQFIHNGIETLILV